MDDQLVVEPPKQQPPNWRASFLKKLNVIESASEKLQPLAIFTNHSLDITEASPFTSNIGGVWGRLLILGNQDGRITSWIIPSRPDMLETASRVLPWASKCTIYHYHLLRFAVPFFLKLKSRNTK